MSQEPPRDPSAPEVPLAPHDPSAPDAPGPDEEGAGRLLPQSDPEPADADPPLSLVEADEAERAGRRRERAEQRQERAPQGGAPQGMVPARERRRTGVERGFMRLVATGGVVAIGVLLGAILVGQDIAGWIVGLVVSVVTVVLAALLWSSRQL